MARLQGIQIFLQMSEGYAWLKKLEKKLEIELNNILKNEKLMWFQRSRAKWLMDSDRNTRYYHIKTIKRMHYNNIVLLKMTRDNRWRRMINFRCW